MNAPVSITSDVAPATLGELDRLADRFRASREAIVARAISDYVERENAIFDLLDAAEAEIDRGEYLTQAQIEEWWSARSKDRS